MLNYPSLVKQKKSPFFLISLSQTEHAYRKCRIRGHVCDGPMSMYSGVMGYPSLQVIQLHVQALLHFTKGLLVSKSIVKENNLRRVSLSHAAVSLHNKYHEQELINKLEPDGQGLCFPLALTTCLNTILHSCLPVANLNVCVCACACVCLIMWIFK